MFLEYFPGFLYSLTTSNSGIYINNIAHENYKSLNIVLEIPSSSSDEEIFESKEHLKETINSEDKIGNY